MGNLLYNPGLMTAFISALLLGGIALWIIIRKQTKRVWLPILQVLRFEQRKLPKLRFIPPPWVSFLAFLVAAVVLTLFTTRPANLIFIPFDPKVDRHHILFDLSPSNQASVSIEAYQSKARSLYQTLANQGKITVSSTAGLEHKEIATEADLEQWLNTLKWHPFGSKMGSLLKAQLDLLGDVDRLYIISDGDQASWGDFNWRFLSDEMDVVWVSLRHGEGNPDNNVYFWDAYYRGVQSATMATWDIDIARTKTDDELTGNLTVRIGDKVLKQMAWVFPKGRNRITLNVSWALSDIDQVNTDSGQPLTWELDGQDSIASDNVLRTPLLGKRQQVLLIGEPSGERYIDDALQQLRVSLDVLGFKVQKIDDASAGSNLIGKQPLTIAVGGTGSGLKTFCPVEELRKVATQENQVMQEPLSFWLAPYDMQADYQELCLCYAALIGQVKLGAMPLYCEDVTHRDHWADVLASLGAKQVGGAVGNTQEALAWRTSAFDGRVNIVAFTAPLRPRVQSGITYASLPGIIKDLLRIEGFRIGQKGEEYGPWSRIDDIASILSQQTESEKGKTDPFVTNVPIAESQLQYVPTEDLPPAWLDTSTRLSQSSSLKQDNADPLPWLRYMAIALIAAGLVEALWILGWRLKNFRRTMSGIAILLACVVAPKAEAQVNLVTFGFSKPTATLTWLSREVSSRTSIDLFPTIHNFSRVEKDLWAEPWLWVYDMRPFTQKNGQLTAEAAGWIKRGGFLVIDGVMTPADLEKLTAKFQFNPQTEGWVPIPADHELLRSFHLLDSLPFCGEQPWLGFQFDGRLAILVPPFQLLKGVIDEPETPACLKRQDREYLARVFINLLMTALATDYKKDQIHLPEILKRLR